MLTPLVQRIFELEVVTTSLANAVGRTERGDRIRMHIKNLRLAAGRVVLAELATRPDQVEPAEAVRMVVDAAIGAGLGWQDVVAIVNTASECRAGGAR